MDHIHAFLIEFTSEPMKAIRIESRLNHRLKKPNLSLGEIRMHATEKREQLSYYEKLSAAIRAYKEVILFGPGSAKTELLNFLNKDHNFQNMIIRTEQTDKLTQGQMKALVRKHFSIN